MITGRYVWKFHLKLGEQEVGMPYRASLLHVAWYQRRVTIWALVDPLQTRVLRRLLVVHNPLDKIPELSLYVGSIVLDGDESESIAYHVFDLGEKRNENDTAPSPA